MGELGQGGTPAACPQQAALTEEGTGKEILILCDQRNSKKCDSKLDEVIPF